MKDKSVFKLSVKNIQNIQPLLQFLALWTTEGFFYEEQNGNKANWTEPSRKETVTEL